MQLGSPIQLSESTNKRSGRLLGLPEAPPFLSELKSYHKKYLRISPISPSPQELSYADENHDDFNLALVRDILHGLILYNAFLTHTPSATYWRIVFDAVTTCSERHFERLPKDGVSNRSVGDGLKSGTVIPRCPISIDSGWHPIDFGIARFHYQFPS